MADITLAHGVGRLYESPIPVWLYFVGAAATVLASFAVTALGRPDRPRAERRIAGDGVARVAIAVLRVIAFVALGLTIVYAVLDNEPGFTAAPLLFWTGLIIGTTIACVFVGGVWHEASPWRALMAFYGDDTEETRVGRAPQWLGPLLVYALFWFELVSGRGFDPLAVALVLLAYTLFVVTLQPRFGDRFDEVDPLSILFGFASRIAALRVDRTGLYGRSPVRALVEDTPMTAALFASLFIVLGSTTVDNLRETVEWNSGLDAVGLGETPAMVVDSIALLFLVLPFLLPYLAAIVLARKSLRVDAGTLETAQRFAWSLIPIAIAYVLAHNLPLFMTGVPQLVQELGEPLGLEVFRSYSPSPQLVWFLEVALIVGGHVLGVLAAHRIAVGMSDTRRTALLSHLPLTVLMSVYTIFTLWLLSLPLLSS